MNLTKEGKSGGSSFFSDSLDHHHQKRPDVLDSHKNGSEDKLGGLSVYFECK